MSAIITSCGLFRLRLDREVCSEFPGSKVFAYFGINPSTADAIVNDQTVQKWCGFTLKNDGHRFIVGNVCSYRATKVGDLASALISPTQHELNLYYLREIIAEADVLVPCWGNRSKVPKHMRHHFDTTLAMLLASGKPVMHFGLTKSGDPKHPLMLGYATPLTPWANAPHAKASA